MTIDSDGTFEVENAPVEFFTIAYHRDHPDWDGEIEWDDALAVRGTLEISNLSYNLSLWMKEPSQFEDHVQVAALSTWTGTILMRQGDPDFGPEIRYQKVG